jgi:hypothetical protein
MAHIELAFSERWRKPMLAGAKLATTRHQRHGDRGDRFTAFGVEWEIDSETPMSLFSVAERCFPMEGCHSSAEFLEAWHESYPAEALADTPVFVIKFHRVVA